MNIIPQYDVVAVTFGKSEGKTSFGIVIPGAARADFGTVVAVGPGYTQNDGTVMPLTVKVGDKVFVGEYEGQGRFKDGETEITLYRASNILAIVEDDVPSTPYEEQ